MPNRTLRSTIAVILACLCASSAGYAQAQSFPNHPMAFVVPFAAGSGSDVLARTIAPRLGEVLGQQVIVENVGGAGGVTGASRVARAAPDGYQFILGGLDTFAQNQSLYRNPPYNPVADFAPVVLVSEQPLLLISRKDLPAQNLQEFIGYARANGSTMQYGSAGAGSASHLACALLTTAIGAQITHIPYRGGAPAMQDLIAGRIDYQCPLVATALPQLESKFVKAIATLSKYRSPILPNLATAREQGLVDFEAYFWNAVFLPKNTPPAIVQKLHDALVATEETPAVQGHLKEIGATVAAPERRSSEYLREFVESEIAKWAPAIKASGVSID